MKIGIELETISTVSQDVLSETFRAAGLAATSTGYSGHNYSVWQMKPDGSISTFRRSPVSRRGVSRTAATQEDRDEIRPTREYRYGVEIVSPALEWNDDAKSILGRAIDIASPYVTVNTSCGFHVHVSGEGLTSDKLTRLKNLWNALEPIVFSYLPPSRRNNRYCARGIGTQNRFHGLNLTCLSTKGTVEFRCHHGTMNKKKILSWVSFCVALVEYAKGNRSIPSITVNQTATGDDIIEVNFRKRTFTITPQDGRFIFAGNQFSTLKDAVLAVVKTMNPDRVRPLSDRFINRNVKRANMENGGMREICSLLAIEPEAQNFLIERYDVAVRTWGLSN
jgi:hypothetical protein